MTLWQQAATIALCVAATMATRFLPFLIFGERRPVPSYVRYLGKALPSAIFAMLVVYCMRNVEFSSAPHGLPELASIAVTVALHMIKRSMLLSIFGGTACYMAIIRLAL